MRGNRLSRVRVLLAAAVAAAMLGGCAGLYAPQARPTAKAVRARPKALRAEAVVELKMSMPLAGRARVLVEGPDKFRIEVLGPFNQVLALLVSDGRELFVFSGRTTEVFKWEDPSMPYPFSAGEVVSFLMGTAGAPPAMNMHSEREARGLAGEGQASESDMDTSLHVEDSRGKAAGSFNRAAGNGYSVTTDKDGRVKDIVKSRGGVEALRVALADYRRVSGADIPFHITIDGRERLSIRYSEVEIDPDVAPGSFSIPSIDR